MEQRTVELPRRFDAVAAKRLIATLDESRGAALRIDASAVENVSALGIEVIISAARQWQADGQSITLFGQSERFVGTCQTLGFDSNQPWKPFEGGQP